MGDLANMMKNLIQVTTSYMQSGIRDKQPINESPRPQFRRLGFFHQPRKPNQDQGKVPNTLSPHNLVVDEQLWGG